MVHTPPNILKIIIRNSGSETEVSPATKGWERAWLPCLGKNARYSCSEIELIIH